MKVGFWVEEGEREGERGEREWGERGCLRVLGVNCWGRFWYLLSLPWGKVNWIEEGMN